jgi:glycosyltransferase involved in cell wall biosynthesis
MKLLVLSICKNEAKTIGELIDQIPKSYAGIKEVEICIIDDGSTDATAKISREHGATVRSDGANKGLAFRFREALDFALESHADIIVNIDGDLQFSPADIPKMIKPIVNGQADFVAADRFTDQATGKTRRPTNMPAGKYYGNKLGARVVSNLTGQSFRDVTCGFRAYNREAILALNLNSTHTYTQESFQILALKRLRIVTLPTQVKYFPERKSRVVTSIFRYVTISALNIVRAYRDFAPLAFFFKLGGIPMLGGVICGAFATWHWAATGSLTPYKAVGIASIYLISTGIFLWGLGLIADMMVRINNTQEKILEETKLLRFDKTPQ